MNPVCRDGAKKGWGRRPPKNQLGVPALTNTTCSEPWNSDGLWLSYRQAISLLPICLRLPYVTKVWRRRSAIVDTSCMSRPVLSFKVLARQMSVHVMVHLSAYNQNARYTYCLSVYMFGAACRSRRVLHLGMLIHIVRYDECAQRVAHSYVGSPVSIICSILSVAM